MGQDIYRLSYHNVFGHLTTEELEFIEEFIPQSDDGSYYVSEDGLDEVLADAKEEKTAIPKQLITALKKELKKNGEFSFAIF